MRMNRLLSSAARLVVGVALAWSLALPATAADPAGSRGESEDAPAARSSSSSSSGIASLNQGLGLPPPGLDLSTPARSLRNFTTACRAGRFEHAARSLWLDGYPAETQPRVGVRLARRLDHVLDQRLELDPSRVSDAPAGRPESAEIPADEDEIGVLTVDGKTTPIRLLRAPVAGGARDWLFSPETVAQIDQLYAADGIGGLIDRIPARLFAWRLFGVRAWQWLGLAAALGAAALTAVALVGAAVPVVRSIARRSKATWTGAAIEFARGPVRALVFLAIVASGSGRVGLPMNANRAATTLLNALWVPAIAWLASRLVTAAFTTLMRVLGRRGVSASADRAMATRLFAARRFAVSLIWLFAAALVLERFEIVKHVSTGLLASASVAGIAVGFAAQQVLRNLFAGLQMVLTQPVRIGDALVFEGEWGTVEEISFTHVVIRVWDLRRLVVPIPYLLDRPIENWTRASTELLGTVFVRADYAADVDAARAHACQTVRASKWWNHRVEPELVITDLGADTIEMRITVSADDASSLWRLRTEVRERMLAWMQSAGAYPRRHLSAA